MSPRYYLVFAIIVVTLTIAISWWKQKKTPREIFVVFIQVIFLWVSLIIVVFGVTELLYYLGIAKSGFIIKGQDL